MGALQEVETAVRIVAERAGPSVVGVGRRWGAGSGVVVEDGRVLTNAHNVRGETVTVSLGGGREAEGTVLGVDADGDLAVINVDTGDAPAIGWADRLPPMGGAILALSDPGGRGLRVTFGLVSGVDRAFRGPRGRRISGSIEHTAPLPRGSSGGPVTDAEGRMVGINTNRAGEGFYLAIPADDSLRERVEALAGGESPGSPRLGIAVAPSFVARRLRAAVGLPPRDGVLVREVEEGGPAARAGIEGGDLIVEVGGRAAARPDDLLDALAEASSSLSLVVVRGTEERSVSVRFDRSEGDRGRA